MKPWVPPEKRPSVTSATCSDRPAPTMAAVTWSISRMPGPPTGPSLRMTTTSPGWIPPLVMAWKQSSSRSKTFAGPACRVRYVGVDQAGVQQAFGEQREPAGAVQVGGDVAAAGLEVGVDGRAGGDLVEVLQLQGHACLVGDGEQVQHRVGGAAGRGEAGDGVLERGAGEDRPGQDGVVHQAHRQLARVPGDLLFALVERGDLVGPGGAEPEELQGAAHEPPRRHVVKGTVFGVDTTMEFSLEPRGSGTRAQARRGCTLLPQVYPPPAKVHKPARRREPGPLPGVSRLVW